MARRLPTLPAPAPVEHRIAEALSKLGLALKHQSWRDANEDGLSPTQGQLLTQLVLGDATTTELARALGVSVPTVSDSVKALEAKDLVSRTPDPRHPRAVLLTPTARGRRVAQKTRAWPEFLAISAGALAPNEREAFCGALLKMIGALQHAGQIPTSRMCFSCVHFAPHAHTGPRPHHCALLDTAMAPHELRLDCPDQEPAAADDRARVWEALAPV